MTTATTGESEMPQEPVAPPDGWRMIPALRQWMQYAFSLRSQLDSVRKERDELRGRKLIACANCHLESVKCQALIDAESRAEAAEQRARDIREECARKVAALRADWEKRLGKGGEFWDGYTSFAKACLKAIMGV
jgi:hypothetical protein